MRCPLCGGDFDLIYLRTVSGDVQEAKKCTQCGGFWFNKGLEVDLAPNLVSTYDTPQRNYSLQNYNISCPNDQTILSQINFDKAPVGLKVWRCEDCDGVFYPRGQLALYTSWQTEERPEHFHSGNKGQVTLAILLLSIGTTMFVAASQKPEFQALPIQTQPLPEANPNILTLLLLALTYLAGIILAVLGRRLPLVLIGWGVILICLIGFAVMIFGP